MRKLKTTVAALAVMMMCCMSALAQKQFTLEDLNFGGKNYANMVPQNRTLRWWGERLVRVSADSCWSVNLKNGKETLLFTRNEINQWLGNNNNKVSSLSYASFPYPDVSLAMLYAGDKRLLVDFKNKRLQWSQQYGGQASEWSKKSRALAHVKDDNLFVIDATGKTTQLTTDGSRDIVYGQSVHRNEFGIEGGLFWNPQGTRLAFYRMDQSMVTDYPLVDVPELDDTTRYIAAPAPEKYPMAGQTSHKVTVGVYDLATGKTVYLEAGDPTDRYFTNVCWNPEGTIVYMQEVNRDQNDCHLVSYDAITGKRIAELYHETHDKYVEPQTPIVFLPWDDSQFIMQSQRDGYNHLYIFKDGKLNRQLTSGKWVVMEVLGFDKGNHNVIIAANAESPIQRNIYRVNIDNGIMTRIDEGGKGWHNAMLSDNGKWLIDNYQEPDVPRNIALVNTATGKALRYFTAPDPWQGYSVPEYRCGSIKAADGITPLAAFSFLLFVLLYFPCIATIAAIKGETGSWRWALFAAFYTTAVAWIVSALVFQLGSLF